MAQNISISIKNDLLQKCMEELDANSIDETVDEARTLMRQSLIEEVDYTGE